MHTHKEGITYQSGVDLAEATKNVKKAPQVTDQNPKGTPNHLLKYKYHHLMFYTRLGHILGSKQCFVNALSIAERKVVFSQLLKEVVDVELTKIHD